MAEAFHRFADDYWSAKEWREMPEAARRVRRALGREPLVDRRHLLPPLALPATPKPLPPGPRPGTSLLVDIAAPDPIHRDALQLAFTDRSLVVRLDGAALWGFVSGDWLPLTHTSLGKAQEYRAVTLAWERTNLPGGSLSDVAAVVERHHETARWLAEALGAAVTRTENPNEAARKTGQLVGLKQRFARSVELRWQATGSPLSARTLWRTAYALGFGWGHLDLFYWPAATPVLTLANLGKPGYFLPERVIEGETLPGVILSFELPTCPVPLEAFDRMALALAAFQELLGGRATDSAGTPLDSERLDAEREAVADAVAQMHAAGIPPGSPEALSFF